MVVNPEILALATLVLTIGAEMIHSRRIKSIATLAFGPPALPSSKLPRRRPRTGVWPSRGPSPGARWSGLGSGGGWLSWGLAVPSFLLGPSFML